MSDNNNEIKEVEHEELILENKIASPCCDVKKCPLRGGPSKDFFLGGAVVAALGTAYWFVRCRGRC